MAFTVTGYWPDGVLDDDGRDCKWIGAFADGPRSQRETWLLFFGTTSRTVTLMERMAIPAVGSTPKITINRTYVHDGLTIEELSWQLPYGRPTEALVLKPLNATGRLPGVLAFHDHGGNKYFGKAKITRTSDQQHPLIKTHQNEYYQGVAWANDIAKRGYVVLVPDAFIFGSRRVMLQDVPEHLRDGLNDNNSEDPLNIKKYNDWAGQHEHVMAKSCATLVVSGRANSS